MLNCLFGLSSYPAHNTLISTVRAVSSTSHPAKGNIVNYEPINGQILKYTHLFKVSVIFRTVWTNFRKILNAKFQENLFSWNRGVPYGKGGRTDRQIDITKLTVAFRYFYPEWHNNRGS